MANRYAVQSGDWSATTTWNGGTLPGPGDVVRPNGFTVAIDQDIELNELRNNAATPAAAGGGFVISSIPEGGREIKANLFFGSVNGPLLSVTAPSNHLTVDGSVFTIEAGGAGIAGVRISDTATVAITGEVLLSHNGDAPGVLVESGATIEVGSSVTAQHNRQGIRVLSGGSDARIIIRGNVVGGTNNAPGVGVEAVNNVSIEVQGDVMGRSAPGINIAGGTTNCAVSVSGNVYGSVAAGGAGILSNQNVAVDIQGECIASNTAHAIELSHASSVLCVSGLLVNAPNGRMAVFVRRLLIPPASTAFSWLMKDDTEFPEPGNDVYLINSPVPTATEIAAAVWNTPMAALTEPNSTGARLKNTATIASTGGQIAAAVNSGT